MNDENIVITQDDLFSDVRQQIRETTDHSIKENNNSNDHSIDSYIKKYKTEHASHLLIYFFVIFTCISIIVSITIVCVVSSNKTNPICRHRFNLSTDHTYNYDSQPYHVAVGDFDQDNHSDIVVVNTGTDNIGIFYNYGNGTFRSQQTYSTEPDSQPKAVAVGHFNNDTYLDIVVADYGINSIGVFLSDGNTSFSKKHILTSLGSLRPVSIAVGDFNNDYHTDIAVVSDGIFQVTLLFGFNNGSFDLGDTYDMGYDSMPRAIIACDLNKDDKMNLAVVNYGTSELVLLINDGNGKFIMSTYSTGDGSYPSSLAVADFNNDTIPDIVVANSGTGNIGLFFGNGNGTVQNMIIVPIGYRFQPKYVVVGDLNNDRRMDIIFLDANQNTAFVLEGYGNGSFTTAINFSTGTNSNPSSMAVADFDNDKKEDLVITNTGINNILVRTLYSRYPTANSTSYSIENSNVRSNVIVCVANLNNDSYPDLVFSDSVTNNVNVRINLGDETFDEKHYFMGKDSRPSFINVIDINNDNYTDIVVILENFRIVSILLNLGNGTFISKSNYSTGDNSDPLKLAIADLNKDNHPDIVIANGDGDDIGIYFGLGDGAFMDKTSLLSDFGYYPDTVTTGDVNNDGIVDIVISSMQDAYIAVLIGYGNGSFQDPEWISTDNLLVLTHVLGDLNNDSRLDILYTNVLYSYVVILLGNGNGTFETVNKYYVTRSSVPWSLALGYYNEDQFIDIAVVKRYDVNINMFIGDGNGSFPVMLTLDILSNSEPQSAVFGDINNDQHNDLIVADPGTSNILIFFTYTTIDFRGTADYTTGAASHPYFITTAYFSNRRSTEVLVVNSGTDTIQLLSNYDSDEFLNSTSLSTDSGSHPQSLTVADFNHDQILDIAVVGTWTDEINVLIGLNNGSFDAPSTFLTGTKSGSAPSSIASGDFNRDGRMDVVVANSGSNDLAVFLAFDYLTFDYNYIYVPGLLPQPSFIITGNFNNDTLIDLAVVNSNNGRFLIYLGYGNRSFSNPIPHLVDLDTILVSLCSGCFNNDTHTDIAVVDQDNNNIIIFLGYGNGSFQLVSSYSTGNYSRPTSAAVADLNHDDHLDIIVASSNSNNIYIFEGTGNGSFIRRIAYSMTNKSYLTWITIADLDNDSNPDVIFANRYANDIEILFGYGNGTFGDVLTLSTGNNSQPVSIAVGDLDKNNRLDIVVANQLSSDVSVFSGLGNRNFSSLSINLEGDNYKLQTVYICDINNDTILDILFTNTNQIDSSLGIIYGLGEHSFTVPTIYLTGKNSQPTSIAIGDFDRDGRVDLAVTYSNHDIICIKFQVGFDPFISYSSLFIGDQSSPQAVAVQDLNNDTYLDIVVANSGTNTIGIFFGYGNGSFHNLLIYNIPNHSHPIALTINHFNNDSYFDIAIVNNVTSTIVILFGSANGTFANLTSYFTGASSVPVSIFACDVNMDNATDLIVANRGSNEILVFYGTNNGSFSTPESYNLDYNARPQSITVADMNSDKMLDIIVANEGASYVEVLLQTC